jgi:uncharacterized protein YciI
MFRAQIKSLFWLAIFAACTMSARAQTPAPTMLTLVVDEAGSAWKTGKPMNEQNMGPHLAYVDGLFKSGKLVAFGTQGHTDVVRGFYVLKGAEPAVAQSFVANDPGIRDGVLKNVSRIAWAAAVDGFKAAVPGDNIAILRYKAGPNWVKGKAVTEQDIGAHFQYMIEQSKLGNVLAAGPSMVGDEGLYVMRGDKAAINALMAADPGVKQGTFKPEVIIWNVIAMQATK